MEPGVKLSKSRQACIGTRKNLQIRHSKSNVRKCLRQPPYPPILDKCIYKNLCVLSLDSMVKEKL